MTVSIALAAAVFASLGGSAAGIALVRGGAQLDAVRAHALQASFTHAFQLSVLVCAAVGILGVLASLVRGEEEPA